MLQDPAAQLAAKIASRERLARMTRLSLPGDPLVQNAIDWGKQNLADLTQSAENLQVRWTDQGKQFPPPLGTVPEATWIGAGFPDYPWIFGTTRSTPRSPRSRWASSRLSRGISVPCVTSPTSSTVARAW